MNPRDGRQTEGNLERLFGALIDAGTLSFPKLEEPRALEEPLAIRMREALHGNRSGAAPTAAELVRARRRMLKLDVATVAGKAELSPATVRAIESGRTAPTDLQPEVFAKLLTLLGIGFESYLDVHTRSIRPGRERSHRSAALRERRSRSVGSAAIVSGWLTRLAEAMKRSITK